MFWNINSTYTSVPIVGVELNLNFYYFLFFIDIYWRFENTYIIVRFTNRSTKTTRTEIYYIPENECCNLL